MLCHILVEKGERGEKSLETHENFFKDFGANITKFFENFAKEFQNLEKHKDSHKKQLDLEETSSRRHRRHRRKE
jgi:uncharacterized protein Yka (UPF0111/DUF47 family)